MQPTPVSVEASEQCLHGVPVRYISQVASRAAAMAHQAAKHARAPAATPTHEVQIAYPSSPISDESPDS